MSNQSVLDKADQQEFSQQLLLQQLLLLGKVARAPPIEDIMQQLTFCPGTLRPVADVFVRRLGRPKLEWTKQVLAEASKMTQRLRPASSMHAIVACGPEWRAMVYEYFGKRAEPGREAS